MVIKAHHLISARHYILTKERSNLRRDEHEHYSNRANWLRAAVLGANDGLVSVASIMLGVGAGSTDQHTLLLSGISALVAGELINSRSKSQSFRFTRLDATSCD